MKKITRLLVLAVLLAFVLPVYAGGLEGLSEEQISKLGLIQQKINGVQELRASEIITDQQAIDGTKLYMSQASEIAGRDISYDELLTIKPISAVSQPSWVSRAADRLAGLANFANILYALAAIIGSISFLIFFGKFIAEFLVSLPLIFYELVAYTLAIVLIGFGKSWSPDHGQYIGLLGSIIAAGCVIFTLKYHFAEYQSNSALFFAIATIIFSATALYYQSSLIGVLASVALLGALGFSAATRPLCYVIGFADDAALARATTTSFLILAVFVILHLTNSSLPMVQIFEPGLMFMGSFVGYLGLLIISSRFYSKDGYAQRQVITVILGLLAFAFGSVLNLPILMKVGGTFFGLYLLEKFGDVLEIAKIRSVYAISFAGMVIAGILAAMGYFILQNRDFFGKYLLFI